MYYENSGKAKYVEYSKIIKNFFIFKKSGEKSSLTESISQTTLPDNGNMSHGKNSAYTYDMRIPSSDSYYRMSKIDIENEKLKKKMKSKSKSSKDEKKKANMGADEDDDECEAPQVVVIKDDEMPDGANDSDADENGKGRKKKDKHDPHSALANIDLDE
jgi:hypothetical protein